MLLLGNHSLRVPGARSVRLLSKEMPISSGEFEKIALKKPWAHFLEVPHSLAPGFLADFRRRSNGGAFAVGLPLDDELVRAVAETIQGALPQHRIIKDRHPFFNPAVGGDDRRAAGMPFDQQIIEVGSGLAGKLLQAEIIYDQ